MWYIRSGRGEIECSLWKIRGHCLSSQAVGFIAAIGNTARPIVAINRNLVRGQLSAETSSHLRFVMAFKAQDCEIGDVVVGRIPIDVVDLNGPTLDATFAASPISSEKGGVRDGGRDGNAIFHIGFGVRCRLAVVTHLSINDSGNL